MIKNSLAQLFSYPVIRLNDSPFTRRLHRLHMHVIGFLKINMALLPFILLGYLIIGFYIPAEMAFSTHSLNCTQAPVVLPRLATASNTEQYAVSLPPRISVRGYPLLSTQICVEPVVIPKNNSELISVKQLHLPFSKRVDVTRGDMLSAVPLIKDDTVSTKNNLIFELSKKDLFFAYEIQVDDRSAECTVQEAVVSCPTDKLSLAQGTPYTFILNQKLAESSMPLYSQKLNTIKSVELINSSILTNQVVYDSPTDIRLTFSKPIAKVQEVSVMQDTVKIGTSYIVDGSTMTINLDNKLERLKSYTVGVHTVISEDGGYLEVPVSIPFSTSGGPKVTKTTLPAYKASPLVDFVLSFDHSIRPEQDFGNLVTVSSGGKTLPAVYDASANELRVRTKNTLPSCSDFTVTVKDGLTSIYGISGGNSYTAVSRTQCSKSFSIGSSVNGQDIIGYSIGGGQNTILFIGAIHGNEKSSYYLLNAWLDYLEANPNLIPSDKKVVVLPKLNPDGFNANSRFNANNVDLNRNFASKNWKKDVKVPGGSILENGGGSVPLSEPESKAIVDYITSTGPSLIMSYHSQGSIVIGNGSGNSLELAKMYSGYVDYENVAPEVSASAFEHDTTGALEDWLHETPQIPVVLLELSSHTTNSIFPYHKQPMLNVIK